MLIFRIRQWLVSARDGLVHQVAREAPHVQSGCKSPTPPLKVWPGPR